MRKISLLIGLLLFFSSLFAQNNSQFISQSAPSVLDVNEAFSVSIVFKNTGSTTWTSTTNYKLGTQNPQDNTFWGIGPRIALPHDVDPGEEVTFSANLITPENGGGLQWQMVQDGVAWFGEKSNIHYINIISDPALDSLLTGSSLFSVDSHVVGTYMFHWYKAYAGQVLGPWIPVEGRVNWKGDVDFWKRMIKQSMAANIEVYYLELIPYMEQERINLFKALFELRREGWDVPKVCPFFDPRITYSIYGYNGDASTEEGKDEIVGHYIRFYNQYFSQNPDLYADDYIYTQDNIPVLDLYRVELNINNFDQITREDVANRLSAEFGDEHPIFNNSIKLIANHSYETFTFADERVFHFESPGKYYKRSWKGDIRTAIVKPGFWSSNISNPGIFIPRDGGTHYQDAWNEVEAEGDFLRVFVETFNEYDQGSGIYAARTDTIFKKTTGGINNTYTDTWSSTNDPYEYIKITAEGASKFNDHDELNAKILWHNIPETLSRGETFTAKVVVRNTGNTQWSAENNFKFGEQESEDPVLFGTTRYLIDDTEDDIPEYGGIFKGRAKTFAIEIIAPDVAGSYVTHWGMLQEGVAWFGDILEIPISVSQSYHSTESESICNGDSILWRDNYYSQEGSYFVDLLTLSGHDSIYQFDLTVKTIDVSVSQNNPSLTANSSGADYQWINCETLDPIDGETSQNFTATENGNYAVIITQDGCIDTSDCYPITGVGTKDIFEKESKFIIYPNPASINNTLNIEGDFRKNDRLFIISINGAIVHEEKILSDKNNLYLSPAKSNMKEGVYIIQVVSNHNIYIGKILIGY